MAERYHPQLICIACNTASTIALQMVRDVLNVPIVGTVPAIKTAAALTRTGTIGLLGTAATVRQHYVDRLVSDFAPDKHLLRYAAGGLVGAAEARLRGLAPDPAVIADAVLGLRNQPGGDLIDTVVLACTHFPLLRDELAQGFGPKVRLIDGAAGIARQIATLVTEPHDCRSADDFAVFTRDDADLALLIPALARYGLNRLEVF